MTNPQPRIVILGGTSGIGLATAKLFASQGARVTVVGRDSEKLQNATENMDGDVHGETANATDRAAIDALFGRIGQLDHLILAASGGAGAGAFADLDGATLRHAFESKFWVHWDTAQASLPFLAQHGSITFVTAASSRLANPGTSGLAAINGALERMVPTLARELAPRRVNAVSPGVVETPWWADKPVGMFESSSRRAPLRQRKSLTQSRFWYEIASPLGLCSTLMAACT